MKKSFKLGLVLMIVPIIIGLLVYEGMPESMPIHFDSNNIADSYASKKLALFGVPIFMLISYIVTYFFAVRDPKRKNQSEKVLSIILILVPILSIITTFLTISYSIGKRPDIGTWISLILQVSFILIGNYLPKVKRNYTMGIRVPWTLHSDYIWEKTHRMAGFIWIIFGFIGIIQRLFFKEALFLLLINFIIMLFTPIIYSYFLYRKEASGNE